MTSPDYLTRVIAPELPRFRAGSRLPKTPTLPPPGIRIEPCEEDLLIMRCVAPIRHRPDLVIKMILNQLAYFDERNAAR